MGNLSGGERSRAQTALLMLSGANPLLLDEPTSNLDIPSAEVLESALDEFEGTVVVISHDRCFLDRVAGCIVALEGGRIGRASAATATTRRPEPAHPRQTDEESMSSTTTTAQAARPGKLAVTAAYYVAFAILGLVPAAIGPTLPALAARTGTDLAGISYALMAGSVGYLVGSFAGGRLYDRVSGHGLMAGTLLVLAITMALTPIAPLLWLLIVVRLILGLASGALDVGGNTLLVWVHGREMGPWMNALHLAFGVGTVVAPVVVGVVVSATGGIEWAYWLLALLALPPALWLLRLPSPPSPAPVADGGRGRADGLLVLLVSLLLFVFVAAEVVAGNWLYSYAVAMRVVSPIAGNYLMAAFWGAFTGGRLLGIPIATRFRPAAILWGDLIACLAGVAVILLWPGSSFACWAGACALGLGIASAFPTAFSVAEERMQITGSIAGLFLVGGSVGGVVLPWLVGQLFEAVGPRVTMYGILADLALAAAVCAALMARSRTLATRA